MLTELRRLTLLTLTTVVAAGLLLWSPTAAAQTQVPGPAVATPPNFAGLSAEANQLAARLEEDLVPLRQRAQIVDQATSHGLPASVGLAVWEEARRVDLDPWLVARVIEVESGWQPGVVHLNADGTRDRGLMQINDSTWPWLAQRLGLSDPLDPAQNIRAGTWYLAMLVQRYGTEAGVTAYNRGEQGLRTWVVSRGTSRTAYSRKVMEVTGNAAY